MKRLGFVAVVLALTLAGCSGSGGTVSKDYGAPDTREADARVPDLGEPDGEGIGDLRVPPLDVVDTLAPDVPVEPLCEPGEGCFLDPCEENGDCLSGWCVEHLGESVCTELCQEECPPGWACKPVGTGGPDLTYICVSNHSNLCKPCATSEGCKAVGGAEDSCLDYGAEGSFCGGACDADADCPWGFLCSEAVTVDGIATKQCVADAGVCPCTEKSIALALTTPCEVTNEHGTCSGFRVCTEEGLSDCDALEPAEEVCDGLDNDCDGFTDEAKDVGGDTINLCHDDNPCTQDLCEGEAGCSYESLTEGECLDGDACTIGDHCEEGVCVGSPIVCDDDNPCTDDVCDGLGGCESTFNSAPCDDGDPCTVADTCHEGTCVGTAIPCDCQQNEDCAALEDGDLCNGTLVCDLETWPYKCVVDPETEVACPAPPAGPDAVCLAAACDPDDGSCSLVPANEGFACNDGDACTVGENCTAGVCGGGVPALCKDDNPCTDDSCDPEVGCLFTANSAPCNDGDVCTTDDQCANGVCEGGATLVCDDGNACNGEESCDSLTGCNAGEPLVCDDGDVCNGTEVCDSQLGCQGGVALNCDDGNPCTDDSCDPLTGCVHTANLAGCDDGNACTVADQCDGGVCVAGDALDCDDDNVCTTDSCTPKTGCVHLLNNLPCDDGDVCTTGDHCALGECIAVGALNCTDANPCTTDSCDPVNGCQFVPNNEPCSDGNACTTGDQCVGGTCQSAGMLDCDDESVCTKDWCDVETGCAHSPLVGPCSDGTDCTVGDTCVDGVCQSGPLLDCDDGNPCTDDSCDPQLGCVNVPNTLACDDGDKCTENDVCAGGVCQPGATLDCDDGNVCTDDDCNPAMGCVYVLNNVPCDDGNACTTGETCADSVCQGGAAVACDDGEACTDDSCDPVAGCLYAPLTPCCSNGVVEEGEECDDGNLVGGDGCEADCSIFKEVNILFTTCGSTGSSGPSQNQCDGTYAGQAFLDGKVTVNAGIQEWTVPFAGTYRIEAFGARGGRNGGYGARMRGDFVLDQGTVLRIAVGQQGLVAPADVGSGGGGGTFVVKADNTPLVIAGGGAGTGHGGANAGYGGIGGRTDTSGASGQYSGAGSGGSNGQGGGYAVTPGNVPNAAGGGGLLGNGGTSGHAKGGAAFVNGAAGGNSTGGFGGGAGSDQFVYGCGLSPHGGGGGGGYSGGGGGGDNCNGAGGGGGSWNSGSNPSNSAAANSGHGKVTIVRQ